MSARTLVWEGGGGNIGAKESFIRFKQLDESLAMMFASQGEENSPVIRFTTGRIRWFAESLRLIIS